MDDPRPVKECVCFSVSFATMKAAGVTTMRQAADRFGSGTNCGECLAYIEKMIATGETEFEVIGEDGLESSVC